MIRVIIADDHQILRDITARLAEEEALRRSKDELQALGAAAHMTREQEKSRIATDCSEPKLVFSNRSSSLPSTVKRACTASSPFAVQPTYREQKVDGSQIDSAAKRSAAERVTSSPDARTTGTTPPSFQRIAPFPPRKRSKPRTVNGPIFKRARQTMPRSRTITCSAVNGSQPLSLIEPCMRRRTADASGVPGAIARAR
jgi:hypothetical protein